MRESEEAGQDIKDSADGNADNNVQNYMHAIDISSNCLLTFAWDHIDVQAKGREQQVIVFVSKGM